MSTDGRRPGEAAICLPYMYTMGEGVTKNMAEAKKWFMYGLKTSFPFLLEAPKYVWGVGVEDLHRKTTAYSISIEWGEGENKMNLLYVAGATTFF